MRKDARRAGGAFLGLEAFSARNHIALAVTSPSNFAYSKLDPLLKEEFMPAVVQTLQEVGWDAYENKGGDVAVSLAGIANEFDTF